MDILKKQRMIERHAALMYANYIEDSAYIRAEMNSIEQSYIIMTDGYEICKNAYHMEIMNNYDKKLKELKLK